jgi:hypothetical protein
VGLTPVSTTATVTSGLPLVQVQAWGISIAENPVFVMSLSASTSAPRSA